MVQPTLNASPIAAIPGEGKPEHSCFGNIQAAELYGVAFEDGPETSTDLQCGLQIVNGSCCDENVISNC